MGTKAIGWNDVIPDSAVNVLLTLPRREVWMPIQVSGDKSILPGPAGGFAPAGWPASKDNVESPARMSVWRRHRLIASEGLRAGLEIASRVESAALVMASLGKRFT